MKQHAVPENIMDVEFKLFGSLTAKQFGYIIVGGLAGLAFYFIFKSFNSRLLGWFFGISSVIIGLSLALIRINEQPFEVWLGNFLLAMFSSQKRVWSKEKKVPSILSKQKMVSSQQNPSVLSSPVVSSGIPVAPAGLRAMPSGLQVKERMPLPSNPFKDFSQKPMSNQTPVVPVQNQNKQTMPSGIPNVQLAGQSVQGTYQYMPGSAQGAVKLTTNQTIGRPISFPSPVQNQSIKTVQPIVKSTQGNVQSVPTKIPAVASNVQNNVNPPIPSNVVQNNPQNFSQQPSQNVQQQIKQNPIPQVQGYPPIVQAQKPPVYTNKAVQFNDVLPKRVDRASIKEDSGVSVSNISSTSTVTGAEDESKALRQKLAQYLEEKDQLENKLTDSKKMYDSLKLQNDQIMKQLMMMQDELKKVQEKSLQQQTLPQSIPSQAVTPAPLIPGQQSPLARGGANFMPPVYNGPSLSKKPNIISGIVEGKDRNLVPGVVVIVKDDKSRPVRAMKTNSLGQFMTTTALENGVYTIELSKSGFSFGRYEVELTGMPLPTYEFTSQ